MDLDRSLAAAGSPAAAFARLSQKLWTQPYVPAVLLEMCRLTLARLHRDELEIAAINPYVPPGELTAPRRAAVLAGNTLSSAQFSATEKAVLLFAECYALDPQRIADEVADGVTSQLGEPGLVFLIEALGCLDGRIRTARCLRDLAAFASPGTSRGQ